MPNRKKVLLCDDDDVMAELLGSILEAEGYNVSVATNGVECLATYAAVKPDLLVVDLEMPLKDGFEVLTELKKRPEANGNPIIVISANQAPAHLERARALGAGQYLIKPFDCESLISKVKEALTNRK